MAPYGADGAPALCIAIYGAGGATGAPGAPEKAIGRPGSMLIGPCILCGKLGPITSKGAAVLALVISSRLDVEARGGACDRLSIWDTAAWGSHYPWSGPDPHQWWAAPRLSPDELKPL